MVLSFVAGLWETLLQRHPLLLHAATWTVLITVTVAVVSFSPEIVFTWAVSLPSSFASACGPGSVRLPLDGPAGEVVCLPPALFFERSKLDLIVPPLFAAIVVAASVCFVRSIGLWEVDEDIES